MMNSTLGACSNATHPADCAETLRDEAPPEEAEEQDIRVLFGPDNPHFLSVHSLAIAALVLSLIMDVVIWVYLYRTQGRRVSQWKIGTFAHSLDN